MRRFYVLVVLIAVAIISLMGPKAWASNSPIMRDCSFLSLPVASVDGDFVVLSGGTLEADGSGNLFVDPAQDSLVLVASESVDMGDQAAHVTLNATITGPSGSQTPPAGAGTGFAIVELPLIGHHVGAQYTISWSATFDNGGHSCPSAITPSNTTPQPFVVKVQ